MIGSYSAGSIYTNTSGSAVFEEVELTVTGPTGATGSDNYLTYTVAGATHVGNGCWNICNGVAQIGFWVPAGATFSATANHRDGGGTPVISGWTEVSFGL
jgi:hypothetical protein